MRTAFLSALMGLACAGPAWCADAAHPEVLELYQSQGCSSCPPADANVQALSNRPDILVLSFAVTYWDAQGWTDTFGSQKFTDRQWAYARRFGNDTVYTPQVVVNGRKLGVGVDPRELLGLLGAADRGDGGPAITLGPTSVSLSAAEGKAADVWLVRYDPRVIMVSIKRGENGGKTLPHKNVVRQLVHLGSWKGEAESLKLPPAADAAWRTAVLVQVHGSGPILAAATS